MIWLRCLLSRLAGTDWRDIATAPFDRPIELAVIDGKIGVLANFCLCHGNDWFGRRAVKPTGGARSMKKMLTFLLLQSHLVSPRKRLDWMFVLSWAGVIVALSILFAVR